MPQETRTSKAKVTVELAESLRKKFNRLAKKNNTSSAQMIRDLMQQAVKQSNYHEPGNADHEPENTHE